MWLLSIYVTGQPNFITCTNLTIANGLADNTVLCITKDSRGFFWFGTNEGLSRYDGVHFKNYFARPGNDVLQANSVYSIHEYTPLKLLINARGKLTLLNTITHVFETPTAFKKFNVHFIKPFTTDLMSISLADSCLLINDDLKIELTLTPPLQQKGLPVIAVRLPQDKILTGTPREYFIYDTQKKRYTPFIVRLEKTMKDPSLFFKYYDSLGQSFYFSNYYTGIYQFNAYGQLLCNYRRGTGPGNINNSNISFITPKNDSILWIGSYETGGIKTLNTRTKKISTLSADEKSPVFFSNSLVHYTDGDQHDWFGTNAGISIIKNTAGLKSWSQVRKGIKPDIRLIQLAPAQAGSIYAAALEHDSIYTISPMGQVTVEKKLSPAPAWCMRKMDDELVITGSSPAITRYNTRTGTSKTSDFLKNYFSQSEMILLAFKHTNGDEWYSGNNNGGLLRKKAHNAGVQYFRKNGRYSSFGAGYYSSCTEDSKGDLWFGVNKSSKLLHWNNDSNHFTEVAFDDVKGVGSSPTGGINDVKADSQDNIWLALDGTGLMMYNPQLKVARQYNLHNGLLSNFVYALEFDNKGRLWIGTQKGLSCLLVAENRFINFTKEYGLPAEVFDEKCIYYDSPNNSLWIGSGNTIIQLDPDTLLKYSRKNLPVYIDEMIVNGEKIVAAFDNIRLRPKQNNIMFSFAGINLSGNKNVEYNYRLLGADDEWINNDAATTATYASLTPGKYTFTVRAKYKGDQQWFHLQQPIRFSIATPWYSTWWFFSLLALTGIGLIWIVVGNYYQRKMGKDKVMQEKNQAIEKERTRIATDMHDDFGASISRIKFLSEKIQLQKTGDPTLTNDLVKISTFSDEMAEKMGEIVWALNQRYDSLDDLISFSRSYASSYLQDKNITLHFTADEYPETCINGETRRNIFLSLKECLHNVVKHSGATQVHIVIEKDGQLTVSIKDNGHGFNPAAVRPFANGLANIKNRMQNIGGNMQLDSTQGTVVYLTIPLEPTQNSY
ncbi:hypothetical protein HY58_11255 [Flavihumibacter sp. ZG627]|nr:hypothetical protein HY58_11255 [Flavihumibacter sp. ZG627]